MWNWRVRVTRDEFNRKLKRECGYCDFRIVLCPENPKICKRGDQLDMTVFCPFCGNLLFAEDACGTMQFACRICPISFPVKRTISNRTYYQLKNVDDILGGEDAWKHCDVTAETCPKCRYPRAYFLQVQTRSADEPMTNFYRCCNPECAHNWRE